MHLAYTAKLGFPVRKTNVGAQKIDGSSLGDFWDGHSRFSNPGQAGKSMILLRDLFVGGLRDAFPHP